MEKEPISLNNNEFITEAIKQGLRMDGREMLELRNISLTFHKQSNPSIVEVTLGKTRYVIDCLNY